MIRVLIVDDEPIVRSYLSSALRDADGIEVLEPQSDGAAGVEAAIRFVPDVVLTDLRMPDVDGITAIRRLRELGSPARIVALTMLDDDIAVLDAMRAGADGYLLKSTPPSELPDLIRIAHRGHVVLSPEASARLLDGRDDTETRRAAELIRQLTKRERAVLALVAGGLSNTAIADRLHVTEATVKGHVSNVLDKLGCRNRTQAGLLAHTAGWTGD